MTPDLPNTILGWAGWLVSTGLVVGGYLLQRSKGKVDESAQATAAWKALLDQHTIDLKELRDELRAERSDNATLRDRLAAAEKTIATLNRKINKQEDMIAGLVRQLAQQGQSTFQVLGANMSPGLRAALDESDKDDAE